MGQDKDKNIEMLTRQIERDEALLANWKAYDISEVKISKLEDKIQRKKDEKAVLEAS
jgi:hypothetical protein